MGLLHEDDASVFHHPILHKGRLIKANGYALVSKAHSRGATATKALDKLITETVEDTRATQRTPDIILNPELLAELMEELESPPFLMLWIGTEADKAVMVQGNNPDIFGLLMPVRVESAEPLDAGIDD